MIPPIWVDHSIFFEIAGKPCQKGSKRAFVVKPTSGPPRAIVADTNSDKLRQWETAVAQAASAKMDGRPLVTAPCELVVHFRFARPKAHFGTGRNRDILKKSAPQYHTQKPDLDKLIRSVKDALTGVVWRDDSLVWRVISEKQWTTSSQGASITVSWFPVSQGDSNGKKEIERTTGAERNGG